MEKSDLAKRNVVAFYDLMFNQSQPREAIRRYVGASYTQHNPHVGDGQEASLSTSSAWLANILASEWSSSE